MKPTVDVLDLDCACGHVLRVHLEENPKGDLDISTRREDACQFQTKAIARIAELEASLLRARAVCCAATGSSEEIRLANRVLDALEGKQGG